jgi:uncharacterized membrane protein YozB (DUF420 family)
MHTVLPHINACMNALSGCLVVAGYLAIRRKNVGTHKKLMLSAFACSTIFLVGYITNQILKGGTTTFPADLGVIRTIYLVILTSHMILAALVVPMVLTTLTLALLGRIEKHRRFARVTLPIWLYVSVTGVIVYLMLYQIYAPE